MPVIESGQHLIERLWDRHKLLPPSLGWFEIERTVDEVRLGPREARQCPFYHARVQCRLKEGPQIRLAHRAKRFLLCLAHLSLPRTVLRKNFDKGFLPSLPPLPDGEHERISWSCNPHQNEFA